MKMKEQIKKLFSLPTDLEEQKASDSRGYKIVSVCFTILLVYLIFVMVINWNLKSYTQHMGLFYITLLNSIGFAIFSIAIYQLSFKAKISNTFDDVKRIKLISYFLFIAVVGVPYVLMTTYLFFDHDYFGGVLLSLIFLGAVLVNYFTDWRPFLKLQAGNCL